MRKHIRIVVALSAAAYIVPSTSAIPAYFRGVGDLPGGGTFCQANAISADGLTVVGASSSAASIVNESAEAFAWTASGGIRGLGDIPGGLFYSNAFGVSGHGDVIVGRSNGPTAEDACYWTQGQLVALSHLPGQNGGSAYGVSADGTTIVGTSGPRAFRWTQSEGMVALPDLAPANPHTTALAASADGSVIVGHSQTYNSITGYHPQAFRWTAAEGMVGLGDLPGGSTESQAESISDDGRVIVGQAVSVNGGEAFRWTASEGMVGLGDLPGGEFVSQAFDVSADGSIIVGRGISPEGNRAFVWDAAHGMRNLHDVLLGEYGLSLTGWELYTAMSVSADGTTIVGIGRNPDGYQEGWIAHVPEPASLLLLALGGLAMMRRRVRRYGSSVIPALVAALLLSATSARALDMETVTVGNPGNAGEWSGQSYGGYGEDRICGAVAYDYRIGKYEVTAGQYTEFLNAVAKTDTYGLYWYEMDTATHIYGCNIKRTGSPGSYSYNVASDWANRPVNFITWGDAARFANWLHNGQKAGMQDLTTTEDGSYYLNGATSIEAIQAVTRNANATWVIPSEDEWYKAAYHKNDGATGNYWDYPTSSDSAPSNILGDPTDPGNNATYYSNGYTIGGPYWHTMVGDHENSPSPYGTFDQGGNLFEWNEAVLSDTAACES